MSDELRDVDAEADSQTDAYAFADASPKQHAATVADRDADTDMMNVSARRAFTIPEVLVATGILLLVLGLTTALFAQAFRHNTLTQENLSNEQLARIALAKVTNSLSQASSNISAGETPAPAIIAEASTAGAVGDGTPAPAIVFYRVSSISASMTTDNNDTPVPIYDVHVISWDSSTGVLNEYVTLATGYPGPSPTPVALMTNVTDFSVTPLDAQNGQPTNYQIKLSVNRVERQDLPEQAFSISSNIHIMQ